MNTVSHKNAVVCKKLSKSFYIIDDKLNWRIVFRDPINKLQALHVLNDINLVVPKGKFIGILGRNGAGKSTLLRVLGGVYSPCSGIIKVNGDISSMFEMGGLGNNRLTGQDYADRFLDIYGVSKKKRQRLINNIKEFSELGNDFYNPIYTYSTGMAARLYFSTATEIQHDIYLVDELLSVGDEYFQAKCWSRLRERFLHGASGILVTHDWSAVLKLCEYSCILDKGQIKLFDRSDEVVRQYLSLPVPSKEYAEILIPSRITLEQGKDCVLRFDILLKINVPLSLNYSIELLRRGYGWEIIMMNEDYIPLECNLGFNNMVLRIPSLPLVPGNYIFNLFLKSSEVGVDSLKIDSRSWTYGNGIPMTVKGDATDAMVNLPWKYQIGDSKYAIA